jgi:DNA helicase-2/ATP-dependent DNA helicase PcrA
MPSGAEWSALRQNALNVLKISAVRDVVRSSYDRILIDEYQDCDPGQHALAIALSEIVPTIVFGDPMQGIFEFANARLRWQRDVYPIFRSRSNWKIAPLAEEKPGPWCLDRRDAPAPHPRRAHRSGLRSGHVSVHRRSLRHGRVFRRHRGSRGNIRCDPLPPGMCDNLARATRGMYQSIEEVAARRLTRFASDWDGSADAQQRLDTVLALSKDCFHKREKQPNEELSPDQTQVIDEMKTAARQLGGADCAEAAREFMRLARRHPRWRLFRGNYGATRACTGRAGCRSSGYPRRSRAEDPMRVSAAGRSLQRRTISTPLLLKGLEFDHVLIPDASHFGNEDYAQASSSTSQSLERRRA